MDLISEVAKHNPKLAEDLLDLLNEIEFSWIENRRSCL